MAENRIEGEGSYTAGKEYQKQQHEFAERGEVEKKAREAEQALDGPEGEELEEARRESAEKRPQ